MLLWAHSMTRRKHIVYLSTKPAIQVEATPRWVVRNRRKASRKAYDVQLDGPTRMMAAGKKLASRGGIYE